MSDNVRAQVKHLPRNMQRQLHLLLDPKIELDDKRRKALFNVCRLNNVNYYDVLRYQLEVRFDIYMRWRDIVDSEKIREEQKRSISAQPQIEDFQLNPRTIQELGFTDDELDNHLSQSTEAVVESSVIDEGMAEIYALSAISDETLTLENKDQRTSSPTGLEPSPAKRARLTSENVVSPTADSRSPISSSDEDSDSDEDEDLSSDDEAEQDFHDSIDDPAFSIFESASSIVQDEVLAISSRETTLANDESVETEILVENITANELTEANKIYRQYYDGLKVTQFFPRRRRKKPLNPFGSNIGKKLLFLRAKDKCAREDRSPTERLEEVIQDCEAFLERVADTEVVARFDKITRIKTELRVQQRDAITWMRMREIEKIAGGIIGERMGLGKTLMTIGLIVEKLDLKTERPRKLPIKRSRSDGLHPTFATLVVLQPALVEQFVSEIKQHVDPKYHIDFLDCSKIPSKKLKPTCKKYKELISKIEIHYDIVITTYTKLRNNLEFFGAFYWHRIMLDEVHNIRNNSVQFFASLLLRSHYRWGLSGSLIHNGIDEFLNYLQFLHAEHLEHHDVFETLMAYRDKKCASSSTDENDENEQTSSWINKISAALIFDSKTPPEWEEAKILLIYVNWNTIEEKQAYLEICGRAEDVIYRIIRKQLEYLEKEHKVLPRWSVPEDVEQLLNERPDVGVLQNHNNGFGTKPCILQLYMLLRRAAIHPCLLNEKFEKFADVAKLFDESDETLGEILEEQNENEFTDSCNQMSDIICPEVKESKSVFDVMHEAPKFEKLFEMLTNPNDGILTTTTDKVIISSEWTTVLKIVRLQLEERKIPYTTYYGKQMSAHMGVDEIGFNQLREKNKKQFNDPDGGVRVLLLSMKAGGTGLNLVAANHIFVMETNWNPQIERQLTSRIARIGQKKTPYVYRLIMESSIEPYLLRVQEKKLEASEILNASKEKSSASSEIRKELWDLARILKENRIAISS